MAKKRRAVKLINAERGVLEKFVGQGRKSARAITRARILLLSDEGRKERELPELLGVSRGTVDNGRKQYQQKAPDHMLDLLQEEPRRGRPIRSDRRVAANVTLIACSDPPAGCGRWPLPRIADKVVKLEVTDSISHERVRRILKKTN